MSYNSKLDEDFGIVLSRMNDAACLHNSIEILWKLLDNIDTADDMAKDNDKVYRKLAQEQMEKRHKVLVLDGYDLFFPRDKAG